MNTKFKLKIGRCWLFPQTNHKNEQGFVLIEALFSTILLSVSVILISQAFQNSIKTIQYRFFYLEPARELAESLLTDYEIKTRTGEKIVMHGTAGRFDYRITRINWPVVDGLQKVEAIISWNDRGKPGEISLTTLFLS